MKIPLALRPVFRFAVHVVVGAMAFLIAYFVAVGVGVAVAWSRTVGAHDWLVEYGLWAETIIVWLDLFSLALFLLKETIKLCRHIILRDWDDEL